MDEKQMEESLLRLKEGIKIDQELKSRLRETFAVKQKKKWRRNRIFSGIAAAIALAIGISAVSFPGIKTVEAASLNVQNLVSFVDIGTGNPLGISEHNGTVYIPVADKGLFTYNDQGFHQLTDREIGEVQVDPTGTRLVWAQDGTIGLYDLNSKTWTHLLEGDHTETFYEQPSWKDEQTILYVKKRVQPRETHGFETVESSILEFNMADQRSTRLADGSYPAAVNGEDAIVFQQEKEEQHHIIYKDLESGKEIIIDRGQFPAVSPNGHYITYVKTDEKEREVGPNAFVHEFVDQVWIADRDGETKRAVTRNIPNPYMDQEELHSQIKASTIKQTLELSGLYSYSHPVWDSDSKSLYVLKNRNMESSTMSIMRIDLSAKQLPAIETVSAFNQAKIRRDLDFVHILLINNKQDFLLGSNPHQVSYSILSSGQENGEEYVDVEEHWAYTANPYYSIKNVRYYISQKEGDYLIERTVPLRETTIYEDVDGTIKTEQVDGQVVSLFTKEELPNNLLPEGDYRISSLAWMEKEKTLLFTLQVLQDPEHQQKATVKVVRYHTTSHSFELLKELTNIDRFQNVGVGGLTISPNGQFAALDLFSDDQPAYQNHVAVLNLSNKEVTWLQKQVSKTQVDATHMYYWEGNNIHFMLTSFGQTLYYQWAADQKKLNQP